MLDFINLGVCAALFWTCFCRVTRTNDNTFRSVRLALTVLAGASLGSAIAPWAWQIPATPIGTLLALGMFSTEASMSRFWRGGCPPSIQRCPR